LAAAEEDELFRIADEALTNVRKHARATDVELSLTADRRGLRLEIADNGRGFNPRSRTSLTSRTSGFGIIGMRERAHALGGRLRIASSPNRGTRVIVTLVRSDEISGAP
jgi:signal transduction histidine kinase